MPQRKNEAGHPISHYGDTTYRGASTSLANDVANDVANGVQVAAAHELSTLRHHTGKAHP